MEPWPTLAAVLALRDCDRRDEDILLSPRREVRLLACSRPLCRSSWTMLSSASLFQKSFETSLALLDDGAGSRTISE